MIESAEVDAGERPGTSSTEHAEIRRLKAENARLREDVAILSEVTAVRLPSAHGSDLTG